MYLAHIRLLQRFSFFEKGKGNMSPSDIFFTSPFSFTSRIYRNLMRLVKKSCLNFTINFIIISVQRNIVRLKNAIV
jgi:hypothetical protein